MRMVDMREPESEAAMSIRALYCGRFLFYFGYTEERALAVWHWQRLVGR